MKKSSNDSLKLTPKLHPFVKEVTDNKELLFELSHGLGSPLNLVFPQPILENKQRFLEVFNKHQVLGKVYYAHKTNQSSSLVRQLATEPESYIDVASIGELRHALGCGFTGDQIGATGPKTTEFLQLCVQHGVLISVDSEQEIDQIISITTKLQKIVKITIRLNSFTSENVKVLTKTSRFGIPISKIDQLLSKISENSRISLAGFAFHLDSTAVKERVVAIESLIELIDKAEGYGFNPNLINIGGGYKVNYLESQTEWDIYTSALKETVLGKREPFTWNGHSFGLRSEQGKIKGTLNTYKFFDPQSSDDYLDALLAQPSSLANQSIGEILRDRMIEVMIEPGRALADQCGITIAKVAYTKKSSTGENMVGVEMNRADLAFLGHEVFIDPILVTQDETTAKDSSSAYLLGNLCLEGDLIFIRKINFEKIPQPGDVLVFANSAGYYSDFSAHNAIMQPKAEKVAVYQDKEKQEVAWTLDEYYKPISN